ncbi:MAG: DoxX family protein [Chloroflexia bacterium]
MRNFALLLVRLTVGGLLAGHGAQKLFGWFGGHGLEGTSGWMESMGLRPGKPWALLAGLSEFGGGVLTLLGFLNPLGSLGITGAMGMAIGKAHWGKPIWVTSGGAELPVINIAVALALGLSGPGDISVDRLLGIKLPRRLVLVPGLILAAASVAYGLYISTTPQPEAQPEEAVRVETQPDTQPEAPQVPENVAGAELQGGQDATVPLG